MALGDDAVLQLIGPAPHQLLQAALPFLPLALQLPAQARQWWTSAISHAPAFFNGEAQLLLQLRQGAQPLQQRCGHGPQLVVVDLPPQTPCCRQGVGELQQIVGRGAAPLAAELHRGAVVADALKAQASLGEAIENQKLGCFRLPALGFLQCWRQLQWATQVGPKTAAGKASHLLAKPLPLQ